jgi:hypothetical protein
MQEVLSKTVDAKVPLCGQEFYELRLYDSDCAGEPVFCVQEARARWDEDSGQPVRDQVYNAQFLTLKEAKEHYAERRGALAEKGFIYSDMDLL